MRQLTSVRRFTTSEVKERLSWLLLAVLSAIPVWIMTTTALAGQLTRGDSAVRDMVLQNRWPAVDWSMLVISWLSSEYASAAILIALLTYLWWRQRAVAVLAVSIMGTSTLWQIWLKSLVGRLRPEPVLYPVWQGAGFPSGHALTALVIAFILWRIAAFLQLRRSHVSILGWSVIIWPVLVGFSRIYLNAHYLSDVTAGLLLGVMHVSLCFTILGTGWLAAGNIELDPPQNDM
jgi:membrane-associated phospholipid phosphatase